MTMTDTTFLTILRAPSRPGRAPASARQAVLLAGVLLAGALAGCGDKPAAQATAAAAAAKASASAADPNLVAAPKALAERLEVQRVVRRPVSEPLSVVGRIDFDEQSVARIGASAALRVMSLSVASQQRAPPPGPGPVRRRSNSLGT
jgi:cobalt-zinc-cadmium efflux system membrane fusion protein